MKLLITFGCSWTIGVGLNYQPGMTLKEFKDDAWNKTFQDQYSFRNLLCQQYNMDNINFACGGSSNQTQFRLAEDYFSSIDFQQTRSRYSEIIVLWGITSILRTEVYFPELGYRGSIFYSDGSPISKAIVLNHLDHNHEVELLLKKMNYWNKVFDLLGIKNIWFDTFNHHDYASTIPAEIKESYCNVAGPDWPSWKKFTQGNLTDASPDVYAEILDKDRWEFYKYFYTTMQRMFGKDLAPRDLLSQLAILNGIDASENNYHMSEWCIDSDKVKRLTDLGVLNPYSTHPTALGHQQIADILSPCFNASLV